MSCAKTNVEAQSTNDSQRIVGTWVGVDRQIYSLNEPLIFNSNGTCSGLFTGKYFISGSNLFIRTTEAIRTYGIFLSPDGKILILTGFGSPGPYWFEKQ
jgi:hypothetical protein